MKNNIAMNFLTDIACLSDLSMEHCRRTGQDCRDGKLWHIDTWGGVKIDHTIPEYVGGEHETVWKFADGSQVLCFGDPTDFEYTEDISLQYHGLFPNTDDIVGARVFRAGCGFGPGGTGGFVKGEYNPIPKPPEPVAAVVPVVEVIPPARNLSSAELALDHEGALEYLEERKEDAATVLADLKWVWGAEEDVAQIYTAGVLIRHEEGVPYWATGKLKAETVHFASSECFVAWALKRFW